MLNEKSTLRRYILALEFAMHELKLFLNSNPDNRKALQLFDAYRTRRNEKIAEYESKYGPLGATADSTKSTDTWKWIKGPWPWENDFWEED